MVDKNVERTHLAKLHHDIHQRRRVYRSSSLEQEVRVLLINRAIKLALHRRQAHLHDGLLLMNQSANTRGARKESRKKKKKTLENDISSKVENINQVINTITNNKSKNSLFIFFFWKNKDLSVI